MVVSVRLLGVGQGGVRAVRRDAGEIRLTDRDLWALRWIGEQYAVRMDQLARLLGSQPGGETSVEGTLSERRTRRTVGRRALPHRGSPRPDGFFLTQSSFLPPAAGDVSGLGKPFRFPCYEAA